MATNKPVPDHTDIVSEEIKDVLFTEAVRRNGETLSVLDALRRSRKARGGVGAPLQVPSHLRDAGKGMGIVITDAALEPDAPVPTQEELDDTTSDLEKVLSDPHED